MNRSPIPVLGLSLALAVTRLAAAAPINSDLAAWQNGGGCTPTGIAPSTLDMLTLIDPEWAPVVNGQQVDEAPLFVHGVVNGMHGDTSGDFPSTHVRSDVNIFVTVDPADLDKIATGNDGPDEIAFEWEAGALPAWAWPTVGDRVVGLGRHIFDCGHPGGTPGTCSTTVSKQCVLDGDCPSGETCVGTHYGYSSELHPPHALATIRSSRAAVLSRRTGAPAVTVTRADVWINAYAGGAGDRCILTHRASALDLLTVACFPLAQPVARINDVDFTFDVPLPAKPDRRAKATWRLTTRDGAGANPARVKVRRRLTDATPHLEVTVLMTKKRGGALPTGFAGTLVVGWRTPPATPLVHLRVALEAVQIDNALKPGTPTVPRTCSVTTGTTCATASDCPAGEQCFGLGTAPGWSGQMSVNGDWQEFQGLGDVVAPGAIAQEATWDLWLPPDGALQIHADAFSKECIDAMFGKPLSDGLTSLGLVKGITCLATEARRGGNVDVTLPGPDFGAGPGGTQTLTTQSVGGQGGHCSLTSGLACVVDGDCPSAESCVTDGGAFGVRYTVTRVS
jgi:hypothetical protein